MVNKALLNPYFWGGTSGGVGRPAIINSVKANGFAWHTEVANPLIPAASQPLNNFN